MAKLNKQMVLTAALAAVLAVVAAGCDNPFRDDNKQEVVHGTGATADQCWPVRYDANRGNRILSAGIPARYRTPRQTTNYLLLVAKRDPRALQSLWNSTPRGHSHPVRDWHSLIDESGKCYSQNGQYVWTATALQMRQAYARRGMAPRYGCNALISGGQATCKPMHITGNRKGVRYTFANNYTMTVMYRCANAVTPGRPPRVVTRPTPRPHKPMPVPPRKPKPPRPKPPTQPSAAPSSPSKPPTTTRPSAPPKNGTLGPGTGTPGQPGGPGSGGQPGAGAGPMCRNSNGDIVPGTPDGNGNCPGATPPTTGGPSPAGPPVPPPEKCIDPNTGQERVGPRDQFGYCV